MGTRCDGQKCDTHLWGTVFTQLNLQQMCVEHSLTTREKMRGEIWRRRDTWDIRQRYVGGGYRERNTWEMGDHSCVCGGRNRMRSIPRTVHHHLLDGRGDHEVDAPSDEGNVPPLSAIFSRGQHCRRTRTTPTRSPGVFGALWSGFSRLLDQRAGGSFSRGSGDVFVLRRFQFRRVRSSRGSSCCHQWLAARGYV